MLQDLGGEAGLLGIGLPIHTKPCAVQQRLGQTGDSDSGRRAVAAKRRRGEAAKAEVLAVKEKRGMCWFSSDKSLVQDPTLQVSINSFE